MRTLKRTVYGVLTAYVLLTPAKSADAAHRGIQPDFSWNESPESTTASVSRIRESAAAWQTLIELSEIDRARIEIDRALVLDPNAKDAIALRRKVLTT
jgi:hypothetical protein